MRFFREMNLPNRITIIRVFLVPVFVLFMCLSTGERNIAEARASGEQGFILFRCIAFALFAAASITDLLDGMIARNRNLITDFGKFMDPLADKLLVCSALVLFAAEGSMPAWVAVLIVGREFVISGVRLLASGSGVVIAASLYGKLKTDVQIAMSLWLLLPVYPVWLSRFQGIISWILIGGAAVFTLLSLIDYIIKNKQIFLNCSR